MTSIPLEILKMNKGYHILCRLHLKNKEYRMLIDTGASLTMLDIKNIDIVSDGVVENEIISTGFGEGNIVSKFVNIEEFTTTVPRVDDERINIHPNPVIEHFKIDGLEGTIDMILMDINGKELLHKEILKDENVSVSEFPAGMYFVKLSNNGLNYKKKIIKK